MDSYSQVFVFLDSYTDYPDRDHPTPTLTVEFKVARVYHSAADHGDTFCNHDSSQEFSFPCDRFESPESSQSLICHMFSSADIPFTLHNMYLNNPYLGNFEELRMAVSFDGMARMASDAATYVAGIGSWMGRKSVTMTISVEKRIVVSEQRLATLRIEHYFAYCRNMHDHHPMDTSDSHAPPPE